MGVHSIPKSLQQKKHDAAYSQRAKEELARGGKHNVTVLTEQRDRALVNMKRWHLRGTARLKQKPGT